MAQLLNVVPRIGRTGGEPALRYTATGQPAALFSGAADRRASKRDDESTGPDRHHVAAFGALAECCNAYLAKGRLRYLSGRCSDRTRAGPDGQQHHSTEIVASDVVLLDRRPSGEAADAGEDKAVSGNGLAG